MKDRGIRTLSVYFLIFFFYHGFDELISRYLYEIGLTESQIGILTSIPFIIGVCLLPFFGLLADRLRKRKYYIIAACIIASAALFSIDFLTDFSQIETLGGKATHFVPLLLLLIISAVFFLPITPIATSIGIEYAESKQRDFGPIRMFGSVGYLICLLLAGRILSTSSRYVYSWQALILLLSAGLAVFFPNIKGHQHGARWVSPLKVIADRKMVILLLLIILGNTAVAFYRSFFGVYTTDLGISNSSISIILFVGALLEVPALFFSPKIIRRVNVWQSILIGYLLNSVRWLLLFAASAANTWQLVIASQMTQVTSFIFLEYVPQVEIARTIAPELAGTAQTILTLCMNALPRFFGAFLGGIIGQQIGISPIFLFWGILLLVAALIMLPLTRHLRR